MEAVTGANIATYLAIGIVIAGFSNGSAPGEVHAPGYGPGGLLLMTLFWPIFLLYVFGKILGSE